MRRIGRRGAGRAGACIAGVVLACGSPRASAEGSLGALLAAAENEPAGALSDGFGLTLTPEDDRATLTPGVLTQFRYNAALVDGVLDDEFTHGFVFQRSRLSLRGRMPEGRIAYRVVGEFGRADGAFDLTDAYVDYTLSDRARLRVGVFKTPFDREFFGISPTRTLLVDRSTTSVIFRFDRSEGLAYTYTADRWRFFASFTDGSGAESTRFDDPGESDVAVTGRVERRFGTASFSQFRDFTGFPGDPRGALLGLGIALESGGDTGGDTSGDAGGSAAGGGTTELDIVRTTLDVGFEGDGWNVGAAFYHRFSSGDVSALPGSATERGDFNDFGVVLQGGRFVGPRTEIAARVEAVFPDRGRSRGDDPFVGVTFGSTFYAVPRSHALKFTGEVSLFNEQDGSSSVVPRTLEASALLPSADAQVALLLQMQLLF